MSINIWLDNREGRDWLGRVEREGILLQSILNIYGNDGVKVADGSIEIDSCGVTCSPITTLRILKVAASNCGYELKLIRNRGSRHEESQVCAGLDETVRVALFYDDNMVKIIRETTPGKDKVRSYKDILNTEPPPTTLMPRRDVRRWTHEVVGGNDLIGLTWILKMHADEKITRRNIATVPSAGEIEWAKKKFGTINKKGKCDLLKYLAIKTGSELLICNATGKGKPVIKGKNMRAKIRYNRDDEKITISLSDTQGHGSKSLA
jgi:hypothetical protein